MSKVKTLYPDFGMCVTLNDSDNTQSRIIIECNGLELDILADRNGIVATLQNPDTGESITELSHDWETDKTKAK